MVVTLRIKLNYNPTSKDYEKERLKCQFLFIPKVINHELRWLERAVILQFCDFKYVYDKDIVGMYYKKYYWKDVEWVD